MHSTFFITSAIATRHSVFSAEQRFAQSVETLNSIRKHAPQSGVIWVEMAAAPLTSAQKDFILQQVDYLIDYTGNSWVQSLYAHVSSLDILKNLTELQCYAWAVATAQAHGWLDETERVFKISGRYSLTPEFDITLYEQEVFRGKYVFKSPLPSQFPAAVTGGAQLQYMSRLWSFDAQHLQSVLAILEQMRAAMVQRLQSGGYIDIEHLLYACMPHAQCLTLDRIGVTGQLGPNGCVVTD